MYNVNYMYMRVCVCVCIMHPQYTWHTLYTNNMFTPTIYFTYRLHASPTYCLHTHILHALLIYSISYIHTYIHYINTILI